MSERIDNLACNGAHETAAMLVSARSVGVLARPHPFSHEIVRADMPEGLTVAQIIGADALNCRVEIAGVEVPERWWPYIKPKAGVLVNVTRFPQGGGGGGWKMVFRIVAFAALAVLTYGIASGVAWMPEFIQGLSQAAAAGVAAAVGIGGMLLINALIPPASSGVGTSTSGTQLVSVTGVQNSADTYGAITCVFGTMLVYPKLAANSFTEYCGDFEYLRCLFDLGYGSLDYAAMQIGTDDLANFTDIDYEVGVSPSLFSQDISEMSAADEMDTDGDTATHTTGTSADETSIDLTFPAGLFAIDKNGNAVTATCKLLIQYKPAAAANTGSVGPVTAIPIVSQGKYWEQITATVTITGDGSGATAEATVSQIGTQNTKPLYGITKITMTANGQNYTYATATLNVSGASSSDTAAVLGTPEIQYSGGAWTNVMSASGLSISNYNASSDGTYLIAKSSAQQSLRIGVRWKNATSDEYQVQVSRVSTDYSGVTNTTNQSGTLLWTTIRTIRYSSPSTTPTTKLAMRIKATNQLNSTISKFNLLLSQVVPVWNGTAWVKEQTSNPAWLYRWLIRDCPANPRRVDGSRIDDDGLIEWGAECDANGFTYNYTNDNVTTVFELLKIICACGRASFTVIDGKYSVVRDVAQTTPVQIFTPRNTANFQGTRAFVDVVHALRVQFINAEATYVQDEVVVYDDGFDETNATQFETLQIPGCTDAKAAWKLGRYHLAVARLRPNSYTWTTDVEHLICNRGDLVYFTSDVISVGLGCGRLKSVSMDANGNVTTVTVDEPQSGTDTSQTYVMRFRCQDGTVKLSVVTFEADTSVALFTLATPCPGLNPGDLFLFGIQGQESMPLLISRVEPSADLAAKLTAVDASPAVLTAQDGYTDSTGTYHSGVPTLVSSITGKAWIDAPPAPRMVICSSSQNLSAMNDQGATSPLILVTVI